MSAPAISVARYQSTSRAPRRAIAILGIVLIAGALVLAGFQLLQARRHLLQGNQELLSAQSGIGSLTGLRAGSTRKGVRQTVAAAHRDFVAAQSELSLWSALLPHLGWIPVAGPQLASAVPLSDAAAGSTASVLNLLDGLQPVWPAVQRGHSSLLQRVAPVLAQQHALFDAAYLNAQLAERSLRQAPSVAAASTVGRAAHHLGTVLPSLVQTSGWLSAAPALLGTDRTAHYLVAWQDRRELRATGGFIGAADYLTVRNGVIQTSPSGSALPHEIDSVAPPAPEAMYTPEGPWIFRDSNWSPDFSTTARLERWFYGQDTGRWADGVIDLLDASSILQATGPVYLPEYHVWVTAANAQGVANRFIYSAPVAGRTSSAATDAARKHFLGVFTVAVVHRLQHLSLDRLPALGAAMQQAVRQGNIQLYDRRANVEAAIQRSHADGRLMAPKGDMLAVVDDNRSYNKLNPFVTEDVTYSPIVHADLSVDATVHIRYHVLPSPATLEGYGPYYGLLGSKHDYQDFLRVYVPRGATHVVTSGMDTWMPRPAYNLTQIAGRLLVRQGQTHDVVIRYALPGNVVAATPGEYRLTVRHQPGSQIRIQVRAQGADGVQIGPNRLDSGLQGLSSDVQISLPLSHYGSPRNVTLPADNSSDPYLPYGDLRQSQHPW